jgi:uncharacterized protein YukE
MTTPEEEQFKKAMKELQVALDEFGRQLKASLAEAATTVAEQLQESSQKLEAAREDAITARVDSIVARNPGIDPEKVRESVRRTSGL